MSDIHGDFETFDKALEIVRESKADVLAISGDLNGNHFDEQEKKQFYEAYKMLLNMSLQLNQRSNGQGRINCYDAAGLITSGKIQSNNKIREKAITYLNIGEKGKKKIADNYVEFKKRFDTLEQRVFIVPGDLDTNYIDDVLAPYNLHLRFPEEVKGFKFAGYGGAAEIPLDIPQESVMRYNMKEGFSHLSNHEDASVVLTHTPPIGFEGSNKYEGNPLLLAYLYRIEPDLILSGHNHVPFVSKEPKTGTIVANPGLLGKYNNENNGTFMEIDVDEYKVSPITLYNLNGQNIDLRDKVFQ